MARSTRGRHRVRRWTRRFGAPGGTRRLGAPGDTRPKSARKRKARHCAWRAPTRESTIARRRTTEAPLRRADSAPSAEEAEEARSGSGVLRRLIMARAPIRGRHARLHGIDVLAASGPGRLAAHRALHGIAHGLSPSSFTIAVAAPQDGWGGVTIDKSVTMDRWWGRSVGFCRPRWELQAPVVRGLVGSKPV